MIESKYDLLDDHERVIASDINLEEACIFLKALMREYYAEDEIMYSIRRHVPKAERSEVELAKEGWDLYAKQMGLDELKSE